MKVFKFGGASVKDAEAVKNVANILTMFPDENIIVVVSAMGKMTNAIEKLTDEFFYQKGNPLQSLDEIRKYHFGIIEKLFPNKKHPVYIHIGKIFGELEMKVNGTPEYNYDQSYDQIVCFGEILSTKIIDAYLNEAGVKTNWLDVRNVIKTDATYREGKVDWMWTEELVKKHFSAPNGIFITQGFLGRTSDNFTTTLGREGSDYTAAILAYCTHAESVTIWKDVPGVLNADPKWFDNTQLIPQLSYQEAIELSYYGATIIHPKTLKPLQNKKIPLYVKSFIKPNEKGTVINDVHAPLSIPCFIFKVKQVLISVSPKDFSFIVAENLSEIFKVFSQMGVKINTMQNSAISFSICADANERKISKLIETLRKNYRVLYNEGLELVTIRHYDQSTVDRVGNGKQVLLEVKSRYTVQMVMKDAY